jgi:ketosteroid isomerase-like protein
MTERRVDGLKAMQEWLAPVRNAKIRFTNRRYEMIGPKVQLYGDVALLTLNLLNYGKAPDKPEQLLARWNITEVYRRGDGKWVIVHSHLSFLKPDVKPPDL